jgi:hypothetical protein
VGQLGARRLGGEPGARLLLTLNLAGPNPNPKPNPNPNPNPIHGWS